MPVAETREPRSVDTDILVVGSGAGGLTAAVTAAAGHVKALVIEKGDQWGGTSAISGGGVWIPGGRALREQGEDDPEEEGFRYLRGLTAANVPDSRIRAFLKAGPQMLDWMETNSHVRFQCLAYPDYHSELPGGRDTYRTYLPLPLDGRRLGKDVESMRFTAPELSLGGRINIGPEESAVLSLRLPGWRKALLRVLARYYLDLGSRLRFRRDLNLSWGNALMGRLRLSMRDRGVPLWLRTRLVSLTSEGGRVTGAIVDRRRGRAVERFAIRASRGVILATGGFESNPDWRADHLPKTPTPAWSAALGDNVGDGIAAGVAAGGAVMNMESAWRMTVYLVPGEARARSAIFERSRPGSLMVNQAGRRYLNEASSYHAVASAMIERDTPEAPTIPSYLIFDARYRRRYPVGPALPLVPDWMLPAKARKILAKAATLEELAGKIGVPAVALTKTVARFNAHARRGEDPDFGRGQVAFDRAQGDPRVAPNPCLGALDEAPYYALALYPGDLGTNGGLVTDDQARVLTERGEPIPGLYAVGNTSASVMGHAYPGGGATIAPAMTFAYLAARHAVGVND